MNKQEEFKGFKVFIRTLKFSVFSTAMFSGMLGMMIGIFTMLIDVHELSVIEILIGSTFSIIGIGVIYWFANHVIKGINLLIELKNN